MHYWMILAIALIGALGGLVNSFVGDSGFHLPKTEGDVWQPGWVGHVVVGALAALGSWAMLKAAVLTGANLQQLVFTTGDFANALVIGFGGAKWFQSESDKAVYHKVAVTLAGKTGDVELATKIAVAAPTKALHLAKGA